MAVLLIAIASPLAAQTSVLPRVDIPNFGKINDNYYRGAQPKAADYSKLARLGIRTVIDLTKNGEEGEPSAVERHGMRFFRIPLTTSDRPSGDAVERFLGLVNDPANQPVYVHCQGGRHRTGLMTALFRLTHDGWSADRAFEEMRNFEFEKGFISHKTLKNFLFDYYVHLTRPAA
jgi:tyrosine-protein phosphatase SIW14